ncbi:GntR family transcriptional regulator [Companilactobacillus jidongensis]|uniref:GntR family transcriptional regulator n=1 Tax=Companilactobacillus jidongensis TaxID=2486006 RepID=UPI000F76A237|nr:GntR family transcriptional regulator [Companilactobacillus jidongensis]
MASRKDIAYDYIKESILSNRLIPGSVIKEIELSEQLKMSRTPIREAIRELQVQGLVESFPAKGTVVTKLNEEDVKEIFELRIALESMALEKSIDRILDKELDDVEMIFDEAVKNFDWEKLHEADRRLHGLIVNKSGSKRLIQFLGILSIQIERLRRLSTQDPNRKDDSYREHMEIINQLRDRNLSGCKDALAVHLNAVCKSALQFVDYQSDFYS